MLEGEIREIDLVPRLIELWREKFTGAIRFEHDGIIKIIYFKDGDVLSASTNDRADSVDEILMRAGKVSREHVKQALAKRKENETLGDALLNLGFITRKELTWARRLQVIGVIRSINEWPAGTYTIVENYLPKREEGTVFPLAQLIVELIVTDTDRPRFERLLDSGSAVFEKAPGFDAEFTGLGLNEEAEAVVGQVDGTRAATEVASASGQESFNAYKLLHALSLLGLLQRAGAAVAVPVPAMSFEDAGAVADAADMWNAPAQFELDDAPPAAIPTPEPAPESPSAPEPAAMPAWDLPPRAATPASAPAPEPPAEPAEEEWHFDQPAKVIAPAAAPARRPPTLSSTSTMKRGSVGIPKKKKKAVGAPLLIVLAAVVVLGAAGYFGYRWWNGRQAAAPVAQVKPRPVVKPVPPPTGTTETIAPPPVVTTATVAPVPEARVVAPRPTPPAAPSDARARYDAMAREFAETATGKFTVQFAIVCEPSNVTRALNAGGNDVWFMPISVKERSCYRMFWRHYETREAGERDLGTLPASLRESKPAVVTIPR